MMKAAVASLLAISAFAVTPGAISHAGAAFAQAGQVQMDPPEFADYDAAMKQATPQTQAPALEAYLNKYPKSAVKAAVLQQIMVDYSSFDHAKAVDAADKVLQLSPNNPQAYVIEVAYRTEAAQAQTDPAAKQSGMDAAADYAQKALNATKPADLTDEQFNAIKTKFTPTYYSTIGNDALGKKDYAGAIAAFKSELSSMPVADTQAPGTALQDTYFLGQAYYQQPTPDLVNCTFYTTRAASYAPAPYNAQLQPLATYCYKKYHGGADGYDAVVTAAKANLNPPADFKITPAPTPADQVNALMSSTKDEDLPKLALGDKEYVIANGTPEQAEKVFGPIKGKETEIPGALVITGSTADQLLLAVSDDAVQSKTADITVNMKTPLKAAPAAGTKITITGVYASYTQKPVMIVMSDGEEVGKKPAATTRKPPVRRK